MTKQAIPSWALIIMTWLWATQLLATRRRCIERCSQSHLRGDGFVPVQNYFRDFRDVSPRNNWNKKKQKKNTTHYKKIQASRPLGLYVLPKTMYSLGTCHHGLPQQFLGICLLALPRRHLRNSFSLKGAASCSDWKPPSPWILRNPRCSRHGVVLPVVGLFVATGCGWWLFGSTAVHTTKSKALLGMMILDVGLVRPGWGKHV